MKQESSDIGFLSEYAGQGLENMTGNSVATPYLTMVQPGSQATLDGAIPGHWRNSATGEDLGESIDVVVLAFRPVWVEKTNDNPPTTIARYIPESIEVQTQNPPAGQKGFPKMINPKTGNEIQLQFMYIVVLPDHPGDGYLVFNPAVGNMKICRSWNSRLNGQILPDTGEKAPVFGSVWSLGLTMVQNPKKPAEKIARLTNIERKGFIESGLFSAAVKPQLTSAKQEMLSLDAPSNEE